MITKNQIAEMEITGITNEGSGVGRLDGMAVFVPQTATGDVIKVQIVKVLKSYAYGIVKEIITPSPARIEPDCPVFRQCGGCAFRHINYDEELKVKSSFVSDSFKRLGGFDIECEPILGCSEINGYRNKAQYPVAMQDGKAVCGFYANRSHRVIPYTACRLQPVIFKKIVDHIMKFINDNKIPAYDETTGRGLIRHIYIRKGFHSGEIMVCLVSKTKPAAKLMEQMIAETGFLAKFPDIKSVVVNVNPDNTNVILGDNNITVYGSDCIEDVMCGNRIKLSPMSFYQVNTEQAEKLYGIAAEFADLKGNEELFDLYCGAGTIGLSMADRVSHLTGVEVVEQAVENAKANAAANGVTNADFICGDAGEIADRLQKEGRKPDMIIVDPPRKGCDGLTLDAIVKMAPEKIVMISCNPATAARDCKILCDDKNGYKLKRVKGIDLFPGTVHCETVVLLVKEGN